MRAADVLPEHQLLLDAFAAFEDAVGGLSPPTVRNHRTYLEAFLRWWERERRDRHLSSATTADLAAFLVAEAARGLSARTRKAEVAALRRFFGWLVLTGAAPADPAAALSGPRVGPPHNGLYTPGEVRAILEHTVTLTGLRGRQGHAIVATLRWTGMRSGELRTLRSVDVQLGAGHARVVGKGSRERTVLLPEPLVEVLKAFQQEVRPRLPASPLLLANPHPFVTTRYGGFGQEALSREVELAGLGAGVPGRHHPHTWRHTYATKLVRAGVDIHVVQRLLGHASIGSTVGYTHLVLGDLRGGVNHPIVPCALALQAGDGHDLALVAAAASRRRSGGRCQERPIAGAGLVHLAAHPVRCRRRFRHAHRLLLRSPHPAGRRSCRRSSRAAAQERTCPRPRNAARPQRKRSTSRTGHSRLLSSEQPEAPALEEDRDSGDAVER